MVAALQARLARWLSNRIRPQRNPVRLDRRHIYILPTGYGYVFALMLLVMFLWAVNYNNSMGFVLTFLLSAVALNTMWHSHNLLLNLIVHPGSADPVFAGQQACFTFRLENPDARTRYGIALESGRHPSQHADIPARGEAVITLLLPAERRGLLRPGRLQVFTHFPLGLFQAWSWVEFEQACLVYPHPQGGRPLPLEATPITGGGTGERGIGSEDYAGLRGYVPGDSPRHVAWKATARADNLLVKRFTDQTHAELWLDWRLLASQPVEARLSQLCQWVLKAAAGGQDYGLRLPGLELPPARGEEHRRRCLAVLALYALPAGEQP